MKKKFSAEDKKTNELLVEIEKVKSVEAEKLERQKLESKEKLLKAKKEFVENKKQLEEEEAAFQLRELESERRAMSEGEQIKANSQAFSMERNKKQVKNLFSKCK